MTRSDPNSPINTLNSQLRQAWQDGNAAQMRVCFAPCDEDLQHERHYTEENLTNALSWALENSDHKLFELALAACGPTPYNTPSFVAAAQRAIDYPNALECITTLYNKTPSLVLRMQLCQYLISHLCKNAPDHALVAPVLDLWHEASRSPPDPNEPLDAYFEQQCDSMRWRLFNICFAAAENDRPTVESKKLHSIGLFLKEIEPDFVHIVLSDNLTFVTKLKVDKTPIKTANLHVQNQKTPIESGPSRAWSARITINNDIFSMMWTKIDPINFFVFCMEKFPYTGESSDRLGVVIQAFIDKTENMWDQDTLRAALAVLPRHIKEDLTPNSDMLALQSKDDLLNHTQNQTDNSAPNKNRSKI